MEQPKAPDRGAMNISEYISSKSLRRLMMNSPWRTDDWCTSKCQIWWSKSRRRKCFWYVIAWTSLQHILHVLVYNLNCYLRGEGHVQKATSVGSHPVQQKPYVQTGMFTLFLYTVSSWFRVTILLWTPRICCQFNVRDNLRILYSTTVSA